MSIPQPGGMPGWPVMTGVERVTNGLSITWAGPSGYYQLFEKQSLADSTWQAVGRGTNLILHAIVNTILPTVFFRVSGPSPHYAGSQACLECHAPVLDTVVHTVHAGVFTNAEFVAEGGQTNLSLLPSHTVGYGLPTGFVSLAKTPKLAGVQCENCHGPAAFHAVNPADPTLVPRVDVAATVCGGCHAGPQHPTFEEWQSSAHSQVIPNLNQGMETNNCGRCHSGTARLSMIEGLAPTAGDAETGIQCANCHDPHQTNGFPAQLRYPLASTNDYFMPTNGAFATYYNTQINVCGQCHNDRGESWTNTAAAPHPSSQYNMLLGTVGELDTGLPPYQPGSHATLLTNQCVDCHMQTSPFVSQAVPADTGHRFTVNRYDLCLPCHPFEPQVLAQDWQASVSNQIQGLKFDLDYWATNKAPASLMAKYGTLAWEYTAPGQLSSGGPGPTAAEQAQIPVNIQKARFNMYVVLSDGSLGVHNAHYCTNLLGSAESWIVQELGR